MEHSDDRVKALLDISTMVTRSDNFYNIKDEIIQKMLKIIFPAKACVNLFGNDYKFANLVCSATLDFIPNYFKTNEKNQHKIPFETYPIYIHEAVNEKKVVWIKDIFNDERSESEKFLAENEGYKSRAVFPLISSNNVIGFMTCFFIESSEKYTDDDIDFISSVASLIGLSVEITRKKKDSDFMIKKLRGSLNLINKATDELYTNSNLDNFLRSICMQIKKITLSESAIIIMNGLENGKYHESIYGENKALRSFAENIHLKFTEKKSKSVNAKYFNEGDISEFYKGVNIKTALYHNLVIDHLVIGYIAVANASNYTNDDLKILNIFSSQIIFAVERYKNAAKLIDHKMMERELELIQEKQLLIMPNNNVTLPNKTKVSYYFYPTANLGGDFCDIFFINDHSLCIFIADVMGHSLLANYFSAMIKGALKSCIDDKKTAAEILTIINHNLYEDFNALDIYATSRLAIIDINTDCTNIANGGHHFPIGVKKVGSEIIAEDIVFNRGLPLGIFHDTKYEDDYYNVWDYELVCIFTDGIIEAYGADGEMFGVNRLKELLKKHYYKSNDEINIEIREALLKHTNQSEPNDDIMLIILNNGIYRHNRF